MKAADAIGIALTVAGLILVGWVIASTLYQSWHTH